MSAQQQIRKQPKFFNTIEEAMEVEKRLRDNGYPNACAAHHGWKGYSVRYNSRGRREFYPEREKQ